jgi:hypothetical protein
MMKAEALEWFRGTLQTASALEPELCSLPPTGNMGKKREAAMARIIRLGRSLKRALVDGYRPEMYYMRGPGPKWRAKHGQARRRISS